MKAIKVCLSILMIISLTLFASGCGRRADADGKSKDRSLEQNDKNDIGIVLGPAEPSHSDSPSPESPVTPSDPATSTPEPTTTPETPAPDPTATPQPEKKTKTMWLISVDQTIDHTLLGTGEIPCKDTLRFVAVNQNSSPYEGEFSGYADLELFINYKELFAEDTQIAEGKALHESESFSFTLKPTGLGSLTRDKSVDPLLADQSDARFTLQTHGDMFESFFIVDLEGEAFTHQPKMDAEWDAYVMQLDNKVTVKIDMFGTFEGTIERLEIADDEVPPEIVDLIP